MKIKKHALLLTAALLLPGAIFLTSCDTTPDGGGSTGGTTGTVPFTPESVRCPGGGNSAPADLHTCGEIIVIPPGGQRAAIIRSLRWPNNKTLKVRFMNGDARTHARVKAIANEWSEFCNIKFDFGDHHPADLRVSFTCGGHWSRVGKGTGDLSENQPTMNLTVGPSTGTTELRRVTLHEFGHALGLIHEHQSPGVTVKWNEPAVLDYYRRTQGWDADKTRRNVLTPYSTQTVTNSVFDPKSIMLYPIAREHTLDGFSSNSNTSLSTQDKAFIAAIYPKQ